MESTYIPEGEEPHHFIPDCAKASRKMCVLVIKILSFYINLFWTSLNETTHKNRLHAKQSLAWFAIPDLWQNSESEL